MLEDGPGLPGRVAKLGHGILPETPVDERDRVRRDGEGLQDLVTTSR